ncbi:hypothetical protein [Treponema sp.]|uniref:hypothetical protein n=1 Tax=Treponema sp. TaxID=166 RepID=UPI0025EAA70C|nr:hypothetical protein [Treponema sp.]MBR4322708.1 hypothetical protein [Treponema sp.]
MPQNSIIVILDFSADDAKIGSYIRDTLSSEVMEAGKIRLVTRNHIDLIFKELDYQYSGYVSDETALSLCQQLGAQALVFGDFSPFGKEYRLQVKMLDVETGSYIIFKNYTISQSAKISKISGRELNYYKTSFGLTCEGNYYSLKGFAPCVGFVFDYSILKRLSVGVKANYTNEVSSVLSIFTIEPLITLRYYLVSSSGEDGTGVFAEGQAGCALINVEDNLRVSLTTSAQLGYRFSLKRFYVEPYIRAGYPLIFGAGASFGVRF